MWVSRRCQGFHDGLLAEAVGMLEREHWPANLRGLRDELVTALEALPEDDPREMVEAVFEPVKEYPALMYAMPCIHSAGGGGIEFELREAEEEALLEYGTDVCGAWEVALNGEGDAKYRAIAVLEAASPPHDIREFHTKLIAYLESLSDSFTENHAVEVFEIVGIYPLLMSKLGLITTTRTLLTRRSCCFCSTPPAAPATLRTTTASPPLPGLHQIRDRPSSDRAATTTPDASGTTGDTGVAAPAATPET